MDINLLSQPIKCHKPNSSFNIRRIVCQECRHDPYSTPFNDKIRYVAELVKMNDPLFHRTDRLMSLFLAFYTFDQLIRDIRAFNAHDAFLGTAVRHIAGSTSITGNAPRRLSF